MRGIGDEQLQKRAMSMASSIGDKWCREIRELHSIRYVHRLLVRKASCRVTKVVLRRVNLLRSAKIVGWGYPLVRVNSAMILALRVSAREAE